MKKLFLGLILAGIAFGASPEVFAGEGQWGVFGTGTDADPDQNGLGAGVFGRAEYVDDIFVTGRIMHNALDDVGRTQLLLGGEWVDTVRGLKGYVGLQVGLDITDNGGTEDAFARIHYDIGAPIGRHSELRIGVARDANVDQFDRKGALRAGWYQKREDAAAIFVSGEFYSGEKNVFAGLSWDF